MCDTWAVFVNDLSVQEFTSHPSYPAIRFMIISKALWRRGRQGSQGPVYSCLRGALLPELGTKLEKEGIYFDGNDNLQKNKYNKVEGMAENTSSSYVEKRQKWQGKRIWQKCTLFLFIVYLFCLICGFSNQKETFQTNKQKKRKRERKKEIKKECTGTPKMCNVKCQNENGLFWFLWIRRRRRRRN